MKDLAPIPARIGDWTVLERLGSGGAASVFRCRRDGREAAVKLLRTGLGDAREDTPQRTGHAPTQLLRRLTREADILMRLRHPNVVRIHHVELGHDPAWLEMDFVAGRHAGIWIKSGPTAPQAVKKIGRDLLSAIAHWQSTGIAHRDIKPGNLILGPRGDVVVVDFGLALDASLERLSAIGVRVGTYAYAPPEWITEEGGDPRAWDLYGAGQVLYELLVGRRAFDPKAGLLPIMKQKGGIEGLDPGPDTPADLRALVRDLTAREPAQRPRTADEALDRLRF